MNNIINFFTTCEQLVLINEKQMFIGYKKKKKNNRNPYPDRDEF